MQTKLIAKNPATGRYYNGKNFDADKGAALTLRPGTTAADFALVWSSPVEIEVVRTSPEYDLTNSLDRGELLARGDAFTALALRYNSGSKSEMAVIWDLKACRSNPEHLGNWEQLLEDLEAAGPQE